MKKQDEQSEQGILEKLTKKTVSGENDLLPLLLP
jgi:hypothetical protein